MQLYSFYLDKDYKRRRDTVKTAVGSRSDEMADTSTQNHACTASFMSEALKISTRVGHVCSPAAGEARHGQRSMFRATQCRDKRHTHTLQNSYCRSEALHYQAQPSITSGRKPRDFLYLEVDGGNL